MADNVTTGTDFSTVPPNTTWAADVIGGVAFPRVKVVWGVDGSQVDASATNPLPVTATISGTWTVATNADGTVAPGTAASKALAVGGVYNTTEPSPTDGQGLALQLDSKGRQRMVIMDAAGNARGANVDASNRMSVLATQTGTWNVTNISGTVSLPTGAATAAKQPALGTAGTASADVITIQGIASMTAVKVDGSGVAQPVTDNSGSLTVDAPVGTPVFVRLSDGAAAIATLPVSLASVPSHDVTNAGTFVTQPQSATAPVSTMNSASANAGLNVAMAGCFDDTSPTAITENRFGFLRMSQNRNLYNTIRDAAGNERGANVNASNQLSVSLDGGSGATVALGAGSAVVGQVYSAQVTVSTGVTRPNDTTAYAANDAWSDSTSSPTSGGFTFTSAARASGGSGVITDAVIVSSNDPATLLQGEIWIYDSATTNINDNSAFASSDSDTLLLVGVIPFTMQSTVAGSGTTSFAHIQNLNMGFTCVGSANLRYLIKVKNAYTPAAQEVLTVRLKIIQTT